MPRTEGETYFNNFVRTGYEEMKDWTPEYYQAIKEADANLRFAGLTIDLMAKSLEEWCSNMFISTMNEDTVSRMEKFYRLTQNASRTLDERRRLLKMAQFGNGKVSVEQICALVETYIGKRPTVKFIHRLEITVNMETDNIFYPGELEDELKSKIPAHIAFSLRFSCDANLSFRTTRKAWKRVSTLSGTAPVVSRGYSHNETGEEFKTDGASYQTYFPMSGESGEAGTYPRVSTGLDQNDDSAGLGVSAKAYGINCRLCGSTINI